MIIYCQLSCDMLIERAGDMLIERAVAICFIEKNSSSIVDAKGRILCEVILR